MENKIIDELSLLLGTDATSANEVELDAADESAIVVSALMEGMGVEEGLEYIMENANEMYAYGLIDNAEAAIEAAKNIVRLNKTANLNRETTLAAIRLARKANSPEYKKYRKYRDLFLEAREAIMQKFGAKAKTEAKKTIANAKRNASRMNTKQGSDITKKMDKEMKKFGDKKSTAIAK